MKRSLKALLVAGAAMAAMVGPAAAPAHAATCIGISYDEPGGISDVGTWRCDPCPTSPLALGDGHFHLIVCLPPE